MVGPPLLPFLLLFLLIPSKCYGFDVKYCHSDADVSMSDKEYNSTIEGLPNSTTNDQFFKVITDYCNSKFNTLESDNRNSCFYRTVWKRITPRKEALTEACKYTVKDVMGQERCANFAKDCDIIFRKPTSKDVKNPTTAPISSVATTDPPATTLETTVDNEKLNSPEESEGTSSTGTTPTTKTEATSVSQSTKKPHSVCSTTKVHPKNDELCNISFKNLTQGYLKVKQICKRKCNAAGKSNNDTCADNCIYQSAYIRHKDDKFKDGDQNDTRSNAQQEIERFCEFIHGERNSNYDCITDAQICYDSLEILKEDENFKGLKCKNEDLTTPYEVSKKAGKRKSTAISPEEEEPTDSPDATEDKKNGREASSHHHKVELPDETVKKDDGPHLFWLFVLIPILGIFGIVVTVVLVVMRKRRIKKARENGLLRPSASDLEGGLLKRPNSGHQKTGGKSRTLSNHTEPDLKPIEAEKMDPNKFNNEGPLKVDVGLKGKEVKHALEGVRSNPLNEVVFDDALNRLVEIGSNIEKLATTDTGKTNSTVTMVDKTKENTTTTKSVDNTTQTQETVEKTVEKTEDGGGEKEKKEKKKKKEKEKKKEKKKEK